MEVWLQCHFHDFLFNSTLVRTYLLTYPLTCWQCNTNSICKNAQTLSRFSCESLAMWDYTQS